MRAVLAVLADHADKRGKAWPSVARISARTGLHPSTVSQALTGLHKQAIINAPDGRSGGRKPTTWQLPGDASTLTHDEGSTLVDDKGSDDSTLADGKARGRPGRDQGSPTASRTRNEPAGIPSIPVPNTAGPPVARVERERSKNGRASGDEPALLDAVAAMGTLARCSDCGLTRGRHDDGCPNRPLPADGS
jgi:hypothetical protein